ncbi:MAG TPA: MFS transporter [Burkholderiales bacterium]|nr:MFS transporter [Burkholderiales bacterium]
MRRDVFLLSAAAFASSASLRATDPLLPLIADDYGVTTGAAAGAATAFALAYGLLQVIYGPLGDRFGRYRLIAMAAFVSAFCSAACALAPDLRSLVAARFVAGATIGAFIPLSVAWIGDTFPYAQRQSLLARYLIGQIVGIGFGTALSGSLAERFGWRAIFGLLAAVLLVLALFLALEARRQPRPAARTSMMASFARMPRLLKRWALASIIVTAFCEGFFIFGALAFVALYFQRRYGVGPAASGMLVALYALGGMLYATVAPRALRAFGEIGLATIGGVALAAGYALLAASPWLVPAAAGLIAIGGGFYMFHTTVQTRLTEVEQKERGSAVALFATFLFTGQAIGLWVASHVVDAAGAVPVFWSSALGLAVLGFAFRRRLLSSRRAP